MKLNQYSLKTAGVGLFLAFTSLNGYKTDLEPGSQPTNAKQTVTSHVTLSKHPGILNTQESLDYIKSDYYASTVRNRYMFWSVQQYINNTTPSKYSRKDSNGNYIITQPFSIDLQGGTINEGERGIKEDALLAYANALAWATTGKPEYSNAAINILNAYGNGRFVGFDLVSGTTSEAKGLESSWIATPFLEAAEIVRHYKRNGVSAGWTSGDITKFRSFVSKLQYYIKTFIVENPDINSADDQTRWAGLRRNNSNRGVSGAQAYMAIGVYLSADDPAGNTIYDKGYDFLIKELTTLHTSDLIRGNDGNYLSGFQRLINTASTVYPNTTPDSKAVRGFVFDANNQDCKHFQYVLNGLTYAAEIANNNGNDDLYELEDKVILDGYNYQYNTQYTTLSSTNMKDRWDRRTCTVNDTVNNTNRIWPAVEVANRYYKNSTADATRKNNIASLHSLAAPSEFKPIIVSFDLTFAGFTTYTHYNVPKYTY